MNEDFKSAIENFVRRHLDTFCHFSCFLDKNCISYPVFPLFMCFNPSNYTLSYAKFYEDSENGIENALLHCHDVIMTSFIIDIFDIFSLFHIKSSFFHLQMTTIPLFQGFYDGFYRFLGSLKV